MAEQTLAQRIKAKYPDYADISDAELEQKVLAKYPEYGDLPRTQAGSAAPQQETGAWSAIKDDLTNAIKSLPTLAAGPPGMAYQALRKGLDEWKSYQQTGKTQEQQASAERKAAGYGPGYRVAANVAENLGVNVPAMEEAAARGDTGGVLGRTVVPVAASAAPSIYRGGRAAAKGTAAAVKAPFTYKRTPQLAAFPELQRLPPAVRAKAIFEAEKIYTSAAPVGTDPKFRGNVYAALEDLSEIGAKSSAKVRDARGGYRSPDMRVRVTRDVINEHLKTMYETERAPQIERHSGNRVATEFTQDAADGLSYLSDLQGEAATRGLAQRAASASDLSLAEMDQLARQVNKHLIRFENMTPAEQATVRATNPKMAGLKRLDRELSERVNNELIRNGEEGLKLYERRAAALHRVSSQLERRINAVELDQPGVGRKIVRPIVATLTGGKAGIASASQAAVADVNVGRKLMTGLEELGKLNLRAQRAQKRPAVRGLLGPGATELPASAEPLGSPSTPQIPQPGTRAERTGRLLPEQTSIDIGPYVEPIGEVYGTTGTLRDMMSGRFKPGQNLATGDLPMTREPQTAVVRDPKTGKMKRVYLPSSKPVR